MTAISGRRCLESFESLNPGGSWQKTFLACFLSTPAWYSRLCFLAWKLSATKHSRSIIRLVASVPRTGGTGFSLLPTASGRDWKDTPGMAVEGTNPDGTLRKREDQLARAVYARMWPTVSVCGNYNRKGASKNSGDGLATAVKKNPYIRTTESNKAWEWENEHNPRKPSGTFWPTPRSADGEKGTRTPEGAARERERKKGPDLSAVVGGKLNADWVEWLMNFPVGWTSLPESRESQPEIKTE